MPTTTPRRALSAGVLAAAMVLGGTAAAATANYTNRFTGEGGSSFGFAWDYARAHARAQALADGFADPAAQCAEVFAFGNVFSATVVWECTRQVSPPPPG